MIYAHAGDPLYSGSGSTWLGLVRNTSLTGRAAMTWDDNLTHDAIFGAGAASFAHPTERTAPGSACLGGWVGGWVPGLCPPAPNMGL